LLPPPYDALPFGLQKKEKRGVREGERGGRREEGEGGKEKGGGGVQ
jgi:hypothetical protein